MASKTKTGPAQAQQGKPDQTKPDPAVKSLQEELAREGFYSGTPDGLPGKKTTDAVAARDAARAAVRASEQADKKLEIDRLNAAANAKKSGAESDALAAAAARKQRYTEQETSPLGIATQSAASTIAPIIAGYAGLRAGDAVNAYADRGQEKRNVSLRGAAADRVSGLTTRKGAIEGVSRAGAMPSQYSAVRGFSRMAPNLLLGGIAAAKGAQLLHGSNEDQGFYPEMVDRAAGLGYIGFGSGLAKKGVQYAFSPGVSPDAQALAVINSEGLRRSGSGQNAMMADPDPSSPVSPSAPSAPEAPRPGTKAALVEHAKSLGIKNAPNTSKAELADKVAEAIREQGAKRAPRVPKVPGGGGGTAAALAAALAYAATPDDAEAAANSGIVGGSRSSALTNAGVAGAIGYGANRLLRGVTTAGPALGPVALMTADTGLEGPSYEATAQNIRDARGQASYYAPWLAENLMGIPRSEGETYQMAQVPDRGDRSPEAMQARAQPEARTPDNDFDMALEDLRALLAATGAGEDDGGGMPADIAPQPMQLSPMAYYPPAMAADNRLLQRWR